MSEDLKPVESGNPTGGGGASDAHLAGNHEERKVSRNE